MQLCVQLLLSDISLDIINTMQSKSNKFGQPLFYRKERQLRFANAMFQSVLILF